MTKNRIITVQDIPIAVFSADMDDYICITDMAAAKSDYSRAADVIKNWLRNRNTLEFLGTWEQIYNSDFKVVEFDHFKNLETHNAQMIREGKGKIIQEVSNLSEEENYIYHSNYFDRSIWLTCLRK